MSFITCSTWVNEIVCWNLARMKDYLICEPCVGSDRHQRGTYPPVTLLGGGRVLSANRSIRHQLRDTGAPPI